MAGSQQTYDARLGRFVNANAIIQTWADYAPTNPQITKAALNAFITDVTNKNNDVDSAKIPLDSFRAQRKVLVFFDKELNNTTCFEKRMEQMVAYLKGELGANNPSYKNVYAILKKIQPNYKEKAPDAPRGAGNSPMEKSFAAAVGQAETVVSIISNIGGGFAYNPPNATITIASINALIVEINNFNKEVARRLDVYGNAVINRKAVYDGPSGMSKRILAIKSYLASFVGGKKSPHYIEFVDTIDGN